MTVLADRYVSLPLSSLSMFAPTVPVVVSTRTIPPPVLPSVLPPSPAPLPCPLWCQIPIISSEQGIGRGLQPLTDIMDLGGGGAGGNWHTTYSPVPHYMTDRMRSVMLENTEYAGRCLPPLLSLDSLPSNYGCAAAAAAAAAAVCLSRLTQTAAVPLQCLTLELLGGGQSA